jgi:hypothetical protein
LFSPASFARDLAPAETSCEAFADNGALGANR